MAALSGVKMLEKLAQNTNQLLFLAAVFLFIGVWIVLISISKSGRKSGMDDILVAIGALIIGGYVLFVLIKGSLIILYTPIPW
jgi:hypothetical protein